MGIGFLALFSYRFLEKDALRRCAPSLESIGNDGQKGLDPLIGQIGVDRVFPTRHREDDRFEVNSLKMAIFSVSRGRKPCHGGGGGEIGTR